jgi:hypothetical protein
MRIIAHRALLNGPDKDLENRPEHIQRTIVFENYDCEIDVWFIDSKWFLGHDSPTYEIPEEFLLTFKDNLWIHAKNLAALENSVKLDLNTFSHDKDLYVLTSKGFIWAYVGAPLTENVICVLPEKADYTLLELKSCFGICTDFPKKITEILRE